MSQTIVRDESTLHRYRTEIPNVVFTLGLTPFELTLYLHLKRTAGECGECWKSVATLAKETGMSAGMIGPAKDGLLKERAEIGGKSLIRLCQQPNPKGGRARHIITITDVWPENMVQFATDTSSPPELATPPHEVQPPASQNQPSQVHHLKFTSSPPELKKNPREEEDKTPLTLGSVRPPSGGAKRKRPEPCARPTFGEVQAFFDTAGHPTLSQDFWDMEEMRGWTQGMNNWPLANWQAAARRYIRDPHGFRAKSGHRASPPSQPSEQFQRQMTGAEYRAFEIAQGNPDPMPDHGPPPAMRTPR